MRYVTLRQFNNVLTVVILFGTLYVAGAPFIPAFNWWAKHSAPIISKPVITKAPAASAPVPDDDTLVIPGMELTETLHEGPNAGQLKFGVWHLPSTGNPLDGGNMVLAGHRFTYQGAAVFYNLDKIKLGDDMTLYWHHKRYDYTVRQVIVVAPTDVAVQAPTDKPQLTVFTCTPLWTSKQRLVLIGTPS